MRLDKRVKDLFRYVGLRSQSLADPTLRYRAPLGAKSRHLGWDFTLPIVCRPRVSVPGRCEGRGQRRRCCGA